MGTIDEYRCGCGYKKRVLQGAGRASYKKTNQIILFLISGTFKRDLIAAMCKDCKELIVVNRYKKKPKCYECKGKNIVKYSEPGYYKVTKGKKIWIGEGKEPDPFISLDEDVPEEIIKKEEERYIKKKNWKIEYTETTENVTYYLCPKCNQFTMERLNFGRWD